MKIREGLAGDDYRDPGPYKYPEGTVAHLVDAPQSEAPRQEGSHSPAKTSEPKDMKGMKGMKGM